LILIFSLKQNQKPNLLPSKTTAINELFSYPSTLAGCSLSGCKHTTLYFVQANLFEVFLISFRFKTEPKIKTFSTSQQTTINELFSCPQTLSGLSLSGCKHTTLFLFPANLFEVFFG